MCPHTPSCPTSDAWDHAAARTVAAHPEQGWSLLCNGVIVFDDTGELLPGGSIILPHIDRVFPLDAADAHRYRHERPNTGKVLLQP